MEELNKDPEYLDNFFIKFLFNDKFQEIEVKETDIEGVVDLEKFYEDKIKKTPIEYNEKNKEWFLKWCEFVQRRK